MTLLFFLSQICGFGAGNVLYTVEYLAALTLEK